MTEPGTVAPLTTLPSTFPADARRLLSRLLQAVGAQDTDENAAALAVSAVGLLLPRYAGTMLKLLSEGPSPAEDLLMRAARMQGQDPANPDVQFRLTLALEYLKRTGCSEPAPATTHATPSIHATPFGLSVYNARFGPGRPS